MRSLIVFLLMSITTQAAQAAGPCGPRDKILEIIGTRFKEARQSLGIVSQSTVIELFVSKEGSFTITSTDTKGMTCVIMGGQDWQDDKSKLKQGAPA